MANSNLYINIKMAVGYVVPKEYIEECFDNYIKKQNRKLEYLEDYLDIISDKLHIQYVCQFNDYDHNCIYKLPSVLFYLEEYNYGTDCFSINGKPPKNPIYDDNNKELFLNDSYVLNDNLIGYEHLLPELINLEKYNKKAPKEDHIKKNMIKSTFKKFFIDLDKFEYSRYLFTWYY